MNSTTLKTKLPVFNRTGVYALLVFAVTVLLYIPTLRNKFVNWDDPAYVYENPYIRSIDVSFFAWMFSSFHAANWHPLTWLSHALDYAFWGSDPAGHHLTSVILHGLNAFLMVMIATRIVYRAQELQVSGEGTGGDGLLQRNDFMGRRALISGVVSGLLFGIHPIHVESVAWVSERKELLCAFFFFLSILAYLRYVPALREVHPAPLTDKKRAGRFYFILCIVFFIFALMSKPMAVTLPAVLLVLDFYPLGRFHRMSSSGSGYKALAEKLPLFILSGASSVLTLSAHQKSSAIGPADIYPFMDRLALAVRNVVFYIVKTVFPGNLAPLYPYPKGISILSAQYAGALLAVVFITAACAFLFLKKQRAWAAAWAFYIITLLPVSGLVHIGKHAAADRYAYLPCSWLFIMAGAGASFIWMGNRAGVRRTAPQKIIMVLFSLLITIVFSVLTVRHAAVWRDTGSLWTAEVELYPDFYYGYYGRGNAYSDSGNYGEAIEDYRKAIQLNPDYAESYNNLGSLYYKLKKFDQAIIQYNRAITLDPGSGKAYYNRGLVHEELQDYRQALADYSKAIELWPEPGLIFNRRGQVHSLMGSYEQALADFSRAIELNQKSADFYNSRAILYARLGRYHDAAGDLKKSIRIDPSVYQTYNNLGGIYAELGNYRESLRQYDAALRLNPDAADTYVNRGMLYLNTGDEQQAVRDFQKAARLGDRYAADYLASKGISW